MVPPFRPDEPVPFHKLDAAAFQRLTRDLLAKEPGVATADEYGINGQAQHGIDVLGYLAHGEGCVVAQCKCYEEIAPADIDAATKDFLSHWDRWKGWKVRRFVLVVACPLRRRELQDAVQAQRRAFKRRGIEYQAWSAEVLRDKLAPHRPIAERYVPREWVDHICGRPPGADLAEAAAVVNVALTSQVTSYKRIISDQAWRDLERLRKEWAEGRRQRVRREVDSLREDAGRWGALSEEVRAEYLRFRAGLELMSPGAGGVALAERLAAEARGLAPSPEDAVLQGLLARARGDREEALELLRGTVTGQARLHEAALLLELGRPDEALGALEGDFAEEHRAEAHRLRALAHLLLKRLERARMEARLALEAEPANLAARMVGGVVAFYSAVSPAAVPEQVPAWPPPVPWDLVRRDADSRARLAEAREQFEALLSRAEREEQERWGLRAWRLAALAVDPERGGEAVERCRRELEDQPGQPALVLWALSRNWPVDLQPSLEAFRREPTPNGVIALVIHALSQDDVCRALALLDEHRGVFAEAGHEGLWRFWKVRALAVAGEFDAAEALIRAEPPPEDPEALAAAVLRARAEREGGWGELASCLVERFRATGEGVYLYEACQAAARQGDWAFAAARARELVEAVATPAALRLAVIACHNAGDFAQARGLLEDFQGLLAGLPPDPDLRKVRVECLRALGIVPKALGEAQALAEEEPTADNLIRLAGLQLGAADVRGLAATVRRLKNLPELAPRQALAAAEWVAPYDRGLAAALVKRACGGDLDDGAVPKAFLLAQELGLEQEARGLWPRFEQLAREGKHGVWVGEGVEQLLSLLEESRSHWEHVEGVYRRGEAPLHVIADRHGLPLARWYPDPLKALEAGPDRTRQPLFAFHGSRARAQAGRAGRFQRLRTDLTALLLAERLGVLEAVESAFELEVSERHVLALGQMLSRGGLAPEEAELVRTLQERVADGLDQGRYRHVGWFRPPGEGGRELPEDHLLSLGLLDLLYAEPEPQTALWADDRWANGRGSDARGTPVVSLLEVLDALVERGVWDARRLRSARQRLRAANVRFVPLTGEEVVAFVREASLRAGGLEEIPDLRLLRRYYAACLADGSSLQPPARGSDGTVYTGELPFALQAIHAAEEAMAVVFAEGEAGEARARADWILDNLHVDYAALGGLGWGEHPAEEGENRRHLLAVGLAGRIYDALHLPPEAGAAEPARARYLDWLDERVLRPRLEADPYLRAALAEALKELARAQLQHFRGQPQHRAALLREVEDVERLLPPDLLQEVTADAGYLRDTGREQVRLFVAGERRFEWEAFLAAARQALRGRPAKVRSRDGATLELRWATEDEDGPWLELVDHERRTVWRAAGQEYRLLLGSAREHEEFLRSRRDWFDRDADQARELIAEIVSTPDGPARMMRAMQVREASAAVFYAGLEHELRQRERIRWDDLEWLPPEPEALLRHLRLDTPPPEGEPPAETWERVARRLLEEDGLEAALLRLCALPVPLPRAVQEALAGRSAEERRGLLGQALRRPGSPVSAGHLLGLILGDPGAGRAERRWAARLGRHLLGPGSGDRAAAFLAVLRWAFGELNWLRRRQWSPLQLLAAAWLHAHRLYAAVTSRVNDPRWIEESFSRAGWAERLPLDALERDPNTWYDAAHPRRVTPELLQLYTAAGPLPPSGTPPVPVRDLARPLALEVVAPDAEGGAVILPRGPLIGRGAGLGDALGSYLAGDPGQRLKPLLGGEATYVARARLEALTATVLAMLDRAPTASTPLVIAGAAFDGHLPEGVAEPLRRVLLAADFGPAAREGLELAVGGFAAACRLASVLQDPDVHRHLRGQLCGVARTEVALEGHLRQALDAHVFECALQLAVRPGNLRATLAELASALREVAADTPRYREAYLPVVARLCHELPGEFSGAVWPLWLEWQAR